MQNILKDEKGNTFRILKEIWPYLDKNQKNNISQQIDWNEISEKTFFIDSGRRTNLDLSLRNYYQINENILCDLISENMFKSSYDSFEKIPYSSLTYHYFDFLQKYIIEYTNFLKNNDKNHRYDIPNLYNNYQNSFSNTLYEYVSKLVDNDINHYQKNINNKDEAQNFIKQIINITDILYQNSLLYKNNNIYLQQIENSLNSIYLSLNMISYQFNLKDKIDFKKYNINNLGSPLKNICSLIFDIQSNDNNWEKQKMLKNFINFYSSSNKLNDLIEELEKIKNKKSNDLINKLVNNLIENQLSNKKYSLYGNTSSCFGWEDGLKQQLFYTWENNENSYKNLVLLKDKNYTQNILNNYFSNLGEKIDEIIEEFVIEDCPVTIQTICEIFNTETIKYKNIDFSLKEFITMLMILKNTRHDYWRENNKFDLIDQESQLFLKKELKSCISNQDTFYLAKSYLARLEQFKKIEINIDNYFNSLPKISDYLLNDEIQIKNLLLKISKINLNRYLTDKPSFIDNKVKFIPELAEKLLLKNSISFNNNFKNNKNNNKI